MRMVVSSLKLVFLLSLFLLFDSTEQQTPRVETKLGAILGKERTSETGKKIFSYTGIPYIKPPVKDLRFKPPVPAEPFQEDFNATNEWIACPQNISGYYFGAEDCVILNVFSPWDPSSPAPATPLSVMVYIHYGAFLGGSSMSMIVGLPDYLLERDVILVTINFRVGVLGFLSTGDEEAPGNYAMLDQVEALRWVKNNIAAFGGNPDKVIVFGQNSGAISTHLLMLSPLTKGLMHGAIVQSGTAISPWGRTNLSRRYSRTLAEKLNCSTSTSSELLECLREKTVEELVKTDVIDKNERYSDYLPLVWSPRIDREADSPFLPDHPFDIMMSGNYNKVPLIIGHTKDEFASELHGPMKKSFDVDGPKMKELFLEMCPLSMGFEYIQLPEEKSKHLCEQVIDYYAKKENGTDYKELTNSQIADDINVMAGVYKSIELMADWSPVYSYSFNYENGKLWFISSIAPTYQHVKGYVPHMDDLLYLFKMPQTNWTTDSPEYEMVETMTKAWTSFAKTGKPVLPTLNEPWPRATSENSKYVVIDEVPTIEEDYRPKDMEFLNSIYSETLYKDWGGNNSGASVRFMVHNAPILVTILITMYSI